MYYKRRNANVQKSIWKRTFNYTFNIEFPKNGEIDIKKVPELEKILPPRQKVDIPADSEEHTLVDIDLSQSRRNRRDEEDDDMPRGAQRVQCANQ